MLSGKQEDLKYHFLSLWYVDLGLNPSPEPLVNTLTIMHICHVCGEKMAFFMYHFEVQR